MGRYITTEDLAGWLSVPDDKDDVEFDASIDAAERAIDQFCGWHFDKVTGEERLYYLPANKNHPIDVDPIAGASNADAIAAITAFDIDDDGDGSYGDDWMPGQGHDFVLEPLNGTLGGIRGIPRFRIRPVDEAWPSGAVGRPQVRITADWGWPTIPDVVKTATLIQSARYAQRRVSREGIAGFEGAGVIRTTGADRDVMEMLMGYRHPYMNLER